MIQKDLFATHFYEFFSENHFTDAYGWKFHNTLTALKLRILLLYPGGWLSHAPIGRGNAPIVLSMVRTER